MNIMIIICLIIFMISINDITTKNSSINRFILFSSCQTNNSELESVRLNNYQYYIHFSSQSLSNSFLSLLPLSYCEHQQTTYYSSSGFSILRSSVRFLYTDIDNNSQQTSPFHRQHNASLSVVDQLLSTPILTLMSSNKNNLLVDSDYDNKTTTATTIKSFLSLTTPTTTSTAASNVSLLHTSQRDTHRTFNITLLIGCISASIILIIIIIYAFVKYRNRDEGSYKIDESKNFVTTPHLDHHNNNSCGGGKISSLTHHHRQKLLTTNEQNGVDSREWYV